MSFGKLAGTAAAFTLAAAGASAETPSAASDASVRELGAVSVTATRSPLRAFEYPGMVSVIGRERLRSRQGSTPDDILSFVPNVEFTGGPRRTGEVPSIRGFGGPDIVILIDGARQNFGSTHDGRFFIDPSLLERVEVLRGPASALYGSGGNGGVIEFTTVSALDLLAPGQQAGAIVSGGHQSVNSERVGNLTAYAATGGGLDLVASVTKRDSGPIRLSDGKELRDTDDDIVAGIAKASLAFSDHHRMNAAFIGFRNDAVEPNNGQQGIGTGETAPGIVEKGIRNDTLRVAYAYDNPDDALLDIDLVAYRTHFQADEVRLEAVSSGPLGELLKRDVDTVGMRLDNRSRLALTDGADVTITYGGEFWRDEQDGADGGTRDGRPDEDGAARFGVPDASAEFQGAFAQAEIAVADPFGAGTGDVLLIPGARYDRYTVSSAGRFGDDNEHSEFSPRVGLSYLPSDWLLLFASYGHAFRAPTINEIYFTGVHFPIFSEGRLVGFNRFEANPNLDPQSTRTFEFGAGLSFRDIAAARDSVQIKATRFRVRGENFIDTGVRQQFPPPAGCIPFTSDRTRVPAGPPGTFIAGCEGATFATNIPNAELQGLEVEATYESARLRAALGYSTIDGENADTGEKLDALAPDQITLDAAVKIPEIDSALGWRLLAARAFDKVDQPQEARHGYGVHDLWFTWRPAGGSLAGFRIDLGVDNVFDKAHTRPGTFAAEPGRNFKLSAGYSVQW